MFETLQIGPKLRWKVLNSIVFGLVEQTQREVSAVYIYLKKYLKY